MNAKLEVIKQYAIARAKEASTWRGAILLTTGMGVHVAPDMIEVVVSIGVGAAGLVGTLFPDAAKTPPQE